ncbi:MAG TPA: ABC transporter substrate-binding protein [Spirochaetota bacterium]|nr:ABC transporter substrate-binding protein [Spirochaetota bacterium]HOL57628.1 ABC transporter substrate-binding protein [Spirochaetota bacterium]HPP05159.1 ABC transporter substrate-binding protein [Spirochaetota bacterium]
MKTKFFIFIAFILLLFSCKKESSVTTTIAETTNNTERPFIIAGIPEEPNRWVNENGELVGLDIDIVTYIMEKIGIPYKIILESSSARLEANWMSDNPPYDMVFTYSKKPEREKYLIYAKESHIDFSWNFFIRKEDEGKYKFEKFEDLKGVKIGATQGIAYSDEFWQAYKDGILTLDIIQKNEIQLDKLLAKRIDMVPLNTQITLYELKTKGLSDKVSYLPKPIKSKPYYNTFVIKSSYPNLNEIITKYDEILVEMKKDGTLKKILAKYGL